MKANELMIGDLVYCTYWPQKRIERVYELKRVADDELKVVVIDEVPLVFQDKYIEPIPITVEILEKNGWVKTKYGYGRDCMEIKGARELPEGVDNALSFARWSIDKDYQYHFLDLFMWKGSVMQHDVHYVHQLQHAARIFGIEMEIKL